MNGAPVRKLILSAIAAVAVLAAAGTVAAQSAQRFPDVPPDHEAFEAIEWAAEVGVTTGYDDGTFKPERPLSKRHAVVFMERYYDQILQADESPDFTRGDMMRVLKAINDGGTTEPASDQTSTSEEPDTTTAQPTSDCHPAYTPCIPNRPGDALNCGDLTSDQKPVTVNEIGVDPYRLDRDNDGRACTS